MDGNEITYCLEKVPLLQPCFLGIFSIDTIPKKINERSFLIFNLSKQKDVGTHWGAMVRPNKDVIEIFDSLSTNIDYVKGFLPFKNKLTILYNESVFQSKTSSSCGKFVIYFCYHRMINLDLNFKLLLESIFSTQTSANEQKVNLLYTDIMNDRL